MAAKHPDPAFPHHYDPNAPGIFYNGMTLRDWFAGQALIGIMAAEPPNVAYHQEEAAIRAFIIADAMLAERAKEPA